jgi:hypothetical protein
MNLVSLAYNAVFIEQGVTTEAAFRHVANIKNELEAFRTRFRGELELEDT